MHMMFWELAVITLSGETKSYENHSIVSVRLK